MIAAILTASLSCKTSQEPAPAPETATIVQEPAPQGPEIERVEGPMPTATTQLAEVDGVSVTVGDFDEASRISVLFAPDGQTELLPEQLAAPHVHLTMTQSLLAQKLIAREASRRGIQPTMEQVHAHLREHPRLAKYGVNMGDPDTLAKQLKPLGLSSKDLIKVAWTEIESDLLASAMVAAVSDDDIWTTYQFAQTTRAAVVLVDSNVPNSKELDAFVEANTSKIEEHFKANESRYRTPKRVKLNIVRPKPGESVAPDVLARAAEQLKQGIQPATVAKELGLEAELDAALIRAENTKAFAMSPAEVGFTEGGPRGAYAWKVVGFEASQAMELTRPTAREIAAELMRTTSVVPSLQVKLTDAVKVVERARLTQKDVERLTTTPDGADQLRAEIAKIDPRLDLIVASFPNSPVQPLPKIGLAEEIIAQAFAVDVGKSTQPILTRERGAIAHVFAANTPTREAFDKEVEKHRRDFIAALKPRIVNQWVQQLMREKDGTFDVTPLRIKYGVLKKDAP